MAWPGYTRVLRELRSLDAILDIGGGDSFSGINGQQRFDAVVAPKQLAVDLAVRLILLARKPPVPTSIPRTGFELVSCSSRRSRSGRAPRAA